jgi:6-phosphogluconate dehydrogenase (decarboxylating)
MMQAYGEGFELIHASEFQIDMKRVASVWMQGSVVRSWLLELAERAFEQEGQTSRTSKAGSPILARDAGPFRSDRA